MAKSKLVLRKKKLSNENYPVVIRLTQAKKSATYIRIAGLFATSKQWNAELSRFNRQKPDYKALNITLNDIEAKIDKITARLESSNSFTFKNWKDEYLDTDTDDNIVNAFLKKISDLKKLNKIGTALFYNDSLRAIKDFSKNKEVKFSDINYKFLQNFVQQRQQKQNSINTIAVYLRGLRSIHYNYCKENDINRPSIYLQFRIKTEPTKNRALTQEQLRKLINYTPSSRYEHRTISIFLLSFYCRGINLMDIAQLKKSNIINSRIEYIRSKTGGIFSINITPAIQAIIDFHNQEDNLYLFPILKNSNNIKNDVRIFNSIFNRILKRIAINLELPVITFYWARYTYASLLREKGVSVELISALLGHSDIKTTKIYLKSFDHKQLDGITDAILNNL